MERNTGEGTARLVRFALTIFENKIMETLNYSALNLHFE